MTFTRLFKSEGTNPETGEVVTKIRVETDTHQVFVVINTEEELKEHGSKDHVLSSLIIKEGIYGKYAQLPRYTEKGDLDW